MNKKEIAQQYTRQILGQEPGGQNGRQEEPEQKNQPETEQLKMLLKEIHLFYSQAQDNYRNRSERQIEMMTDKFGRVEQMAVSLSLQIREMKNKADQLDKLQNRIFGRWIIRLYLICILVGCISALMTLLIVWMKMH